MNHYSPEIRTPTESASPLFASVWVALYHSLRDNFVEHRAESLADDHAPLSNKGNHPNPHSKTNQ